MLEDAGVFIGLGDLTPDPKNARRHTPRNVGMIEAALNEVGAARSIVIDEDGVVLAGNATIEAAAQAGIERVQVVEADGETIIAVRRRGLTPEQKTKLALFDNRAAELADWDTSILSELSADMDLSQLFRDEELAELLAGVGEIEPGGGGDEFDTVPEDGPTRTALGDLWVIGTHRLIVGDCTDPAVVERLMGGERADIGIFDPPYGMRLDASYANSHLNSRLSIQKSKGYAPVTGDHEDYDPTPVMVLFKEVKEQFWWGADYYRQYLPSGGSWLAWDKRAGMTEFDYTLSEFELCWSRTPHHRKILRVRWFGAFGTETQDTKVRIHPTQKPLGVYTEVMERHSKAGDLVVDTYLGSGTTLIAAHRLGRRCYGCEIEPKYADVILRRAESEGLACSLTAGLTCTRVGE